MKFVFLFMVLLMAFSSMTVSAARACACQAVYRPVCATNGQTYSNQCSMRCAGAEFQYDGNC